MFIRLKAIFLEKEFLSEGTIASKIELNEVQQQEEPVHTQTTIESDLIRSNLNLLCNHQGDLVEYRIHRIDIMDIWSRMAILLSSMKTMRIRSPIWMQCKGLIPSYGLKP